MAHILLVDDDHDITALLSDYLRRYQHTVTCAHHATGMREALAAGVVDLIVLDWMLPGTDGLTLAREVRLASRTPVIMLTARSAPVDCIMGLESGADDFMSKPFEPRELVARIQAVLRRSRDAVPAADDSPRLANVVWFDRWRMHRMERHLTSPAGVVVPLSTAEFRLLNTFLAHPRKLLSREQLLDEARGRGADGYDRSIDLLVSRLRQKLAKGQASPVGAGAAAAGAQTALAQAAEEVEEVELAGEAEELIKTVRGAGYMFTARQVHSLPNWGG